MFVNEGEIENPKIYNLPHISSLAKENNTNFVVILFVQTGKVVLGIKSRVFYIQVSAGFQDCITCP